MCFKKRTGKFKCKNLENSYSERHLQSIPFLRKIDEKIDIFNKNINTLRHKKVALVLIYVECRKERPLQSTSKCLTKLNSSHRKTPNHKILC